MFMILPKIAFHGEEYVWNVPLQVIDMGEWMGRGGWGGVLGGQPFWFIAHTFANHGLRLSLLPNNVKIAFI